jgi:hypothetical protein
LVSAIKVWQQDVRQIEAMVVLNSFLILLIWQCQWKFCWSFGIPVFWKL